MSGLYRVEVLQEGDLQGNGAVLRLTTRTGLSLYALAVPQDVDLPTGPTWVYLLPLGGYTLVDAGNLGSYPALRDLLGVAGVAPRQVRRVVVTHGHPDHEGAVPDLVAETGAEVWAHELYGHLLPFDPWSLQGLTNPLMGPFLERRVQEAVRSRGASDPFYLRHRRYLERRRTLRPARLLREGERWERLTFWHTPGHTPDSLCIRVDSLLLTGDTLLPEISPHPSIRAYWPPEVREAVPPAWRDPSRLYGLRVYLATLRRLMSLGDEVTLLPAHRLMNRRRLHLLTARRAREILQHHRARLRRIVALLKEHGPLTVERLTALLFRPAQLQGPGFYAGLSETVAHLELLVEVGDVALEGGSARWQGTERYRQEVLGGPEGGQDE